MPAAPKPRPVGRPPLGKSTARLELRIASTDLKTWQAAATRQGSTLSEFVREAVEMAIARGSSR